jgi:sporulation protein YlmC with PRC-barrel domain
VGTFSKKTIKSICFVVLMCFLTFSFTGCAMDPNASNTEKGAATGAGAGALAGALWGLSTGKSDNVVKGAFVGALVGGAVGALAGWVMDYKSRQVADYRQTKTRTGYKPTQGEWVRVSSLNTSQKEIDPGKSINFNGEYVVMTPEDKEIEVKEVRTLMIQDPETKEFVPKSDEGTITMKPGTRQFDSNIPIPANAQPGNYKFALKVAHQDKEAQQEVPFSVVRKQGKLIVIIGEPVFAMK